MPQQGQDFYRHTGAHIAAYVDDLHGREICSALAHAIRRSRILEQPTNFQTCLAAIEGACIAQTGADYHHQMRDVLYPPAGIVPNGSAARLLAEHLGTFAFLCRTWFGEAFTYMLAQFIPEPPMTTHDEVNCMFQTLVKHLNWEVPDDVKDDLNASFVVDPEVIATTRSDDDVAKQFAEAITDLPPSLINLVADYLPDATAVQLADLPGEPGTQARWIEFFNKVRHHLGDLCGWFDEYQNPPAEPSDEEHARKAADAICKNLPQPVIEFIAEKLVDFHPFGSDPEIERCRTIVNDLGSYLTE